MDEQQHNLWERQFALGESAFAYRAFAAFLAAGPGRSPVRVYREVTKKPNARRVSGTWNKWITDYNWNGRAQAYDAWMMLTEQEAIRRVAETRAEAWARRREELREAEYKLHEKLLARAQAMLDWPLKRKSKTISKVTRDDGVVEQHITVIEPARWIATDVARYVETASKVGRLAVGMETERTKNETELTITAEDVTEAEQDVAAWEAETFGFDPSAE